MTKRDYVRPVKGFKATDCLGCCTPTTRNRRKFIVGKTYRLKQPDLLRMCWCGFHFCERLYEVFHYYPKSRFTRVFEVEAVGKVLKSRRYTSVRGGTVVGKCVTDSIRIVRELSKEEILDRLRRESVRKDFNRDLAGRVLSNMEFEYNYPLIVNN